MKKILFRLSFILTIGVEVAFLIFLGAQDNVTLHPTFGRLFALLITVLFFAYAVASTIVTVASFIASLFAANKPKGKNYIYTNHGKVEVY